jgi:hypothetical protein
MKPDWHQFEVAVAAFIQALGPGAAVSHNLRLPDKHTRTPRQRDVWIKTLLLGHFPLTALVSCKRYKRKVDQLQIEHFSGELTHSGAQLGILYSYSGFTAPAIEKAKALGIVCCLLYSNRAPDIPAALILDSFCFTQRVMLEYFGDAPPPETLWNQIFDEEVRLGNGTVITVLDELDRTWQELGRTFSEHMKAQPAPYRHMLQSKTTFTSPESSFSIQLSLLWKAWRGRLEAHLLNGSYCISNGKFAGSMTTPIISLTGPSPGPGWDPIDLTEVPDGKPMVQAYLYAGGVKQELRESLGRSPVRP